MLTSIHRAGILHGDIRRENILTSELGVTIIDFSHSTQCDDQRAMHKKYAQLRFSLGFE
jgi:tRNA A-37 threonylcarbamoyl transferase component Bud32